METSMSTIMHNCYVIYDTDSNSYIKTTKYDGEGDWIHIDIYDNRFYEDVLKFFSMPSIQSRLISYCEIYHIPISKYEIHKLKSTIESTVSNKYQMSVSLIEKDN